MCKRGAFIALLLASQGAAAHGSVQGLGNFFSGVVHPLFEPAHLIVLIGLGLMLGQRGLARTHPAVPCFIGGSVLGLAAAGLGWTPSTDAPLLALSVLAGLAVATAVSIPPAVCALAAGLVGLGVGLGSAPEATAGSARIVMLAGTAVGGCVWMLNVVGLVHEVRRAWLLVLVRVAGSWITASAVLVLALWVAGKPASAPTPTAAIRAAKPAQALDTSR